MSAMGTLVPGQGDRGVPLAVLGRVLKTPRTGGQTVFLYRVSLCPPALRQSDSAAPRSSGSWLSEAPGIWWLVAHLDDGADLAQTAQGLLDAVLFGVEFGDEGGDGLRPVHQGGLDLDG